MTLEEYQAAIADAMADPATALEKTTAIMSALKTDLDAKAKAEADLGVMTGNWRKAQSQYNQLAFLRTGNPAGAIAAESSEPPKWDDVMKSMAVEIAGEENVYHGPSQ